MGNCCSNTNSKFGLQNPELHIEEFRSTYKSLKFPKSIAFTGDPSIFRIYNASTNKPCMLKRITFSTESELSSFTKNLDSLIQLDHDNLVKIYHYSIEDNQLQDFTICHTVNIVLEHYEHTLEDEIIMRSKAQRGFNEKEIQNFLNSIVDALEFLQLKGITLGNLRPSTIYITKKINPKIMVLGTVPTEASVHPQGLSHAGYMSPQLRAQAAEQLYSDKVNLPAISPRFSGEQGQLCNSAKSDVFSLGLIVLDMMSKRGSNELAGNYRESIRRKYRVIQCDKTYGPFLCNLIKAMLRESELIRPDFLELKKMLMVEEYMEAALTPEGKLSLKEQEQKALRAEITGEANYEDQRAHLKKGDGSDISELSMIMGIGDDSRARQHGRDNSRAISADEFLSKKSSIDFVGHIKAPTKQKPGTEKEGSFIRHLTSERSHSDEGSHDSHDHEEEEGSVGYDEVAVETEDDLCELYQKETSTLRKLVINLEEHDFTEETKNMLKEVISRQSLLNELVISLPKAKLNDDGLQVISQGMDGAKEMSMCYFDFRKTGITDRGLKKLGECLLKKKKLIQVALNFSDNEITDEGCKEIAGWFENLKEIKSLALNVGGTKVRNKGIITIGKNLGKLEELESLMIFLYTNEIQGKEGVVALLDGINKLQNLEKINLNLGFNMLKDKELDVLLDFLKESEVDEIVVDLRDNAVSEEGKKKAKLECVKKENATIRF